MDIIDTVINEISWSLIIATCMRLTLLLVGAWIASWLLRNALRRFQKRLIARASHNGETARESEKRIDTIVRLLRQAGLLVIWVTLFLVLLREIGVEIGPIIASAGIVGLAIGFGAQNLVRDVISGFFIILENQVRVGDVAVINDTGGLVEAINFRTIVLRDVAGVVHYFPNGTITTLSNMTTDWSAYVFNIEVAYKENTDNVIAAIKEVLETLAKDDTLGHLIIGEPEVFGVDKLGDSAAVVQGRIKTQPIQQWTVGREFLRRVKLRFDEQNIAIPYPHSTVYFGESSKPFDIRMLETASLSK